VIYCFDIDGTICTNTDGAYERAEPHPDVIARVNALFDSGDRITLYTARGSTTGIDWFELTEKQLRSWGVNYHQLILGKPTADVYIDDKATNVMDWLGEKIPVCPDSPITDPGSDNQSMLASSTYLDVTYSPARVPYGEYPYQLAKWLLGHVCKHPGRVLDVGCGRGEHMAVFAQLGFDVAGVDISPRAPELAQGFHVEVADLEHDLLPFPPNSFDFVFSKSVIEHMQHPECLLSKSLEGLRPGGTVIIMTPSWAHTHWGPFYIDHTHVTPFTAPSLSNALTIAGFESVKVSHFYQLPFLWRYPFLKPIAWAVASLPLPYRPYQSALWPDPVNKVIRFSKEVMLLGIGKKPSR
jgi:SAM-dependent methyltransferase